MKPAIYYLAVASLFLASSLTYAGCNNYGAAGIHCTGPDGYAVTKHSYGGGVSTINDNRGNRVNINEYEGSGYIGVSPQSPLPSGSSSSSGLNVGSQTVPYSGPFAR